ncbi:hypothetical protein V9P73_004436 [Yersinia enterocolitica]
MRMVSRQIVWVRLSGVAMALNQMGLPALFRWMLFEISPVELALVTRWA